MKLLLDENLPRKLKYRIKDEYEVLTVSDLGWSGKKNGDLLKSMENKDLSILISGDKNMGYQQSFNKYIPKAIWFDQWIELPSRKT